MTNWSAIIATPKYDLAEAYSRPNDRRARRLRRPETTQRLPGISGLGSFAYNRDLRFGLGPFQEPQVAPVPRPGLSPSLGK
jgi:hypothetical protein